MSTGFKWTCPYCHHAAIISEKSFSRSNHVPEIPHQLVNFGLQSEIIVCPNQDCGKTAISVALGRYRRVYSGSDSWTERAEVAKTTQILPDGNSRAKPFPDYIPVQILADYNEACAIHELSPKASATLSRRCLQGMLRNFWSVKPGRLVDEIDAIKSEVDATSWQAITAVRELGNIGAHMEKDVSLIVDVEPDEADLLISLIEVLLQEWYVRRQERQNMMAALISVAAEKKAARKGDPTSAAGSVDA